MDPVTMMLVAGGLSLGGNIAGGLFGKSGSDKGAEELADAQREATAAQLDMFNRTEGYYKPYREAGYQMLPLMTNEAADVGASPLYNFRMSEGTKALNQQLAARGLYGSGAGLELHNKLNTQLTAEETDKMFGRQATLAGYGLNASGGTASAATQTGAGIANIYQNTGLGLANLYGQQGRDTASLYSGAGNMMGGMVSGYGKDQMLMKYLSQLNANKYSPAESWQLGA